MFWTIVLGIVVGGVILMALPSLLVLICWGLIAFVNGVIQTFRPTPKVTQRIPHAERPKV